MNFYFLPNFDKLKTSVTMTNFASMESHEKAEPLSNQFIHVTWSNGKIWHHRVIDELVPGESRSYGRHNLPSEIPSVATPFLYFFPTENPSETEYQVQGTFMKTLPNWRGNIKFISNSAESSYQGEYPGEMLNIKGGSNVSLGPMIQTAKDVYNKLIFVNMTRSPEFKAHELLVAEAKTKNILSRTIVYNNTANIVDLDCLSGDSDHLKVIVCKSMAGIPIYLTHSSGYSEMSIEHSHPPISSVIFGESIQFQRNMKSFWLGNL